MSMLGIVALLAMTLTLALAGVVALQRGRAEREALAYRTELGFAERQGRRLDVVIDRALRRTAPGRALGRRLSLAGLQVNVIEAVLAAAAGAVVAAVVVNAVFGRVTAFLAAVAVLVGANAWLNNKMQQRREVLIAQLPEVARVLSNALSAGLALPAAMAMVTNELTDPAAEEFRKTVHALRIGRSVDQALNELADRLPSRELGVMVTTLVVQQRAGGDLVGALRSISDTLEARKKLRQELKTATSGVVATSYGAVGLIVAVMVMLNVVNPGIIDQLTGTFLGRLVVAAAVLLYAVGFLAINRIVRIEV